MYKNMYSLRREDIVNNFDFEKKSQKTILDNRANLSE